MSKAAELIRERIAEIDNEVGPVIAKVQPLIDEKEELRLDLNRVERGDLTRRRKKSTTSGNGSPKALISDERVIEVLKEIGAPARSPQVAAELGVAVQAVSRQLTRMVRENVILGSKDTGYEPMPLAVDPANPTENGAPPEPVLSGDLPVEG